MSASKHLNKRLFIVLGIILATISYFMTRRRTFIDVLLFLREDLFNPYLYPAYLRVLGLFLFAGLTVGLVVKSLACAYSEIVYLLKLWPRKRRFVKTMTEEQYELETKEVTEIELEKLRQTEAYQKIVAKREEDPSYGNWQTEERRLRERAYKEGRPELVDNFEDEEPI